MVKRHWHELDSLRGLAALAVFFSHALGTDPVIEKYQGFLRILWDGASAVDLFFVLSGFVLYASSKFSVHRSFWAHYSSFLVKRFFRLYPLLWTSLVITLACQFAAPPLAQVDTLSEWARSQWSRPPGLYDWLANGILLLPGLDSHAVNPVIWSLSVEMKMSLVLPFLFILVDRLPWPAMLSIVSALVLVILAGHAHRLGLMVWSPAFLAGALVAKHHNALRRRMAGFSVYSWATFVLLGIFLYGNRYAFPSPMQGPVCDLLSSAGAAMLILSATCQRNLSRWLHAAPFRYSGRMSYGLYLLHMPLLFLLITVLAPLPLPWLVIIALGVSMLLAHHLHHRVEQPCIMLGRSFSSRQLTRSLPPLH